VKAPRTSSPASKQYIQYSLYSKQYSMRPGN
jgi:hypothetical protein